MHTLIQAVGGLPLALTLMGNYLRLQGESGQTRRIQAALEQVHSLKTRFELSEPWTPLDHHPSLADEQVLTLDSNTLLQEWLVLKGYQQFVKGGGK